MSRRRCSKCGLKLTHDYFHCPHCGFSFDVPEQSYLNHSLEAYKDLIHRNDVDGWNKYRECNTEFTVDLRGVDFHNQSLQGANFSWANLARADFSGADLTGANFEEANLESCDFSGAILTTAKLRHANMNFARFSNTKMDKAYMSGAHMKNIRMDNTDLKGAVLIDIDFEGAHFWKLDYDRKAKYQGIRVSNSYGSPSFKRFAQDQDFLEELQSTKKGRVIYFFWSLFADCGRSIGRWALWCFIFALGFALLFYWLPNGSFDAPKLGWSFFTSLYYSVVTFTTLGFGDVVPKTKLAAGFVIVEVIIGYVMLGGLISIFANKLARRS